jgi:ribosomal protein S18 acetylase RimI-like enzyme
MLEVCTATVRDRRAIGRTLATAFAADPVLRWLMPTPERDVRMFRVLAAHLHAAPGCADVALERGDVVGAALWDPPGHHVPLGQALVGFPRLLAAMRWSGFRRGAMLESAFTRARPAEHLWYLAQLGAVTPGRGVGSALLEHRLASIDRAAYLESSNQRNVPLYQRFGFEVINEISLPDDGPTLWTMLRR